jgi:adenylate kinase
VIRRRLEVYHSQTEPLIAYYDRAELLRRFDGRRTPDEVHAHIRATVATLRLEENL